MDVNKTCETCEYCAYEGDSEKSICIYSKNSKPTEETNTCDRWSCSFSYFEEIFKNLPPEIRKQANGPFASEVMGKYYKTKL